MGPDEFATRNELRLVFAFMLAKMQQQAETISDLMNTLSTNGGLSQKEALALVARAATSPTKAEVKKAEAALYEFADIRKIAKQYLDPPEG
jgi:polyhydroxyalkanoate synthesis regulator phasin